MSYDEDLNKLIDETKIGVEIKSVFDRSKKVATYLNKIVLDAISHDGEFTSPVITSFTEENQLKMKAYILAIENSKTNYLNALELINNPKDIETE